MDVALSTYGSSMYLHNCRGGILHSSLVAYEICLETCFLLFNLQSNFNKEMNKIYVQHVLSLKWEVINFDKDPNCVGIELVYGMLAYMLAFSP